MAKKKENPAEDETQLIGAADINATTQPAEGAEPQPEDNEPEANEFADKKTADLCDEMDTIDAQFGILRERRSKIAKAINARLRRKGG